MGRKLEFDYDRALERATRVFWAKGYVGASMRDLLKAMGVGRLVLPSVWEQTAAVPGMPQALQRRGDEAADGGVDRRAVGAEGGAGVFPGGAG